MSLRPVIALCLSLSTLVACQSGMSVPPIPQPSSSASGLPSANPSATPSGTPTATPTPPPSSSPGPSAPPLGSSDCHPDSEGVRLRVYSNPQDIFYGTYGVQPDKSQPIAFARIEAGGVSVTTDANGVVVIPRPKMSPVPPLRPDDPPNFSLTVSASADGYHPHSQVFYNDSFCGNNFVALSPLSAEEKAGQQQPLEKVNLSGELNAFPRDEATGLYYGLIQTPQQLDALQPSLSPLWGGELSTLLEPLYAGLRAGKAVAFLSNGSQGLGDTYDLIQRLTVNGQTAILAGHQGIIQQDPVPPRPVGDRFKTLIEAVVVPGDTAQLLFQVLPYQHSSQRKLQLNVSATAAQPQAVSSSPSSGS